MTNIRFIDKLNRKIIVVGHYGSGKTEFSVSLAMLFATVKTQNNSEYINSQNNNCSHDYTEHAIVDLDIINPYFRSREKREMLLEHGIHVYGSAFNTEVTAELPALGADVRTPLENNSCRVIVDTGGNDSGALPLNQFSKYFTDDTTVLAVVNSNRPNTGTIEGAIEHVKSIEKITNLHISGIVNNTHMMQHTTADDIIFGHEFCEKICKLTDKELYFNCYPQGLVDPNELVNLSGELIPLGQYMNSSS